MNGVFIIDKPEGITSHDVVAKVRRILKTKRVGHTGTLDPFATGVMVLLIGQATRLAQFLDKDEKEYEAVIQFGFETDTGDKTGKPTEQAADNVAIRKEDIESVLGQFRGAVEQTPPMYSAKKVEGEKLYNLARKGIEISRESVQVFISRLEIIDHNADRASIRVACSAGTYVRTLASDIALAAGARAHLSELRRIRAGKFHISDAVTLEELATLDERDRPIIPMQSAVDHLPQVILSEDRALKTKNGLSTRAEIVGGSDGQPVRMCSETGELLAIGIYSKEGVVRPKIVLI